MALVNLGLPGRMKLSTGVLLYADDESFTPMTPEGHMLAGWITFSAGARDGVTVVQIQALSGTNDPLHELGYVLGGNRLNTSDPDGREPGPPSRGRAQGRLPGRLRRPALPGKAGNIGKNAAVRTFVWTLGTPVRWLRRPSPRRSAGDS